MFKSVFDAVKKGSVQEKYVPGKCGLINMGNTCYMNSAVQCLSNISIFTEFGREFKKYIELYSNEQGKDLLILSYLNLIDELWSANWSSVEPVHFRSRIRQMFEQYNNYQQNDCSEFLTTILSKFHDELMEMKGALSNDFPVFEDFEEYLKVNDTFIGHNFQGWQKFSLICERGHTLNERYDPFYLINLPQIESSEKFHIKVVLLRLYLPSIEMQISTNEEELLVPFLIEQVHEHYRSKTGIRLMCKEFIVTHVIDNEITKIYSNQDQLKITDITGTIYIYEIDPIYRRHIFIVLRSQNKGFAEPLLLQLSDSTYSYVHREFIWTVFERLKTCDYNIMTILNNIEFWGIKDDYQFFFDKDSGDLSLDNLQVIMTDLLPDELVHQYEKSRVIQLEKSETCGSFAKQLEEKSVKLENCIEKYLSKKDFDKSERFSCKQCGTDCLAKEKIDIFNAPNILMVQLKSNPNKDQNSKELHCKYPLKFNLGPYVSNYDQGEVIYDLIAVSNIKRFQTIGHYTTFAQNYRNKKWYEFNDSSVTEIMDESKLISPNAYIVVYLKNIFNN